MDVFYKSDSARFIRFLYIHLIVGIDKVTNLPRSDFNSLISPSSADITRMVKALNDKIDAIYKNRNSFECFSRLLAGINTLSFDERRFLDKKIEYLRKCFFEYFHLFQVKDEKFDWLVNGTDRAVDFCWTFIRVVSFDDLMTILKTKVPKEGILSSRLFNRGFGDFLSNGYQYFNNKLPHKEMNLSEHPSGRPEKIKQIIFFVDNVDFLFLNRDRQHPFDDYFSIEPYARKKTLIDFMHSSWQEASADNTLIRWVEKNKSRVDWAWSYFLDKFYDGKNPQWLTQSFNSKNKRNLLACYDLLAFNPDKKKLFFSQLTKTNSQKNYRENMKDRKQVNMSLKNDVKLKLDKLAEAQGKKLYEVVEELINKEFMVFFDKQ